MFSINPSTFTPTSPNMATARRASISARSCGVETITAPSGFSFWASVSCTSPVPGGRSITSTSSTPQSHCSTICTSAELAIGPRQTIAFFGSVIMPIDSALMPCASAGCSRLPSSRARPSMPRMVGTDGP